MKRIASVTLGLTAILLALLNTIPAFAQTTLACASVETVTEGVTLSKIAAAAYGDPYAYFPIISATNSQAIADNTFHFIDNPDQIEIGWKICVPAAQTAPAGLARAELQNATFNSEFGKDGVATLVNGKFSTPGAPNTPLMNSVFLGNEIAYGEINGTPSAAVILVEAGGGSGVFYALHLVQTRDGKATDIASTQLGDRINPTALFIQDNKIVVGMTTQGPDEPMCCGTQRVVNTYTLSGDKLEQASTQIVGNVEQTADTQPPATQPTAAPAQTLAGGVWKWTGSLFSDEKRTTPNDPNQYLLSFSADGKISVQADCNRVLGTYTTDGNQLTITLGPSTLVACPPDSLGDEFTRQLGIVNSYFFKDGNLILEFKFDSGSMTFAPSAPSGLNDTRWNVVSYNNGKQAVVSLLDDTEISLNFADGRASGNASCNNYTGPFDTSGDILHVGGLATTFMLCHKPDGIMAQEMQYLTALQSAQTYEIAGDMLTIRDNSGAMQVVAKANLPTGLAATQWQVTGYNNGNQAVVSLLDGTAISMNFSADNRVSGNASCNNYNGGFESNGDALQVGALASTRMACAAPEGIMAQEQQFLAALQNAATYEISGAMLTIRDASGAMQVTATAQTASTLADSAWEVTNINNGKQAVVSLIADTKITLNFDTAGNVNGNSGCNTYAGGYKLDGAKLQIGPLISTLRACETPAGLMEQEQQYLAALQNVATFEISGNTLTLRDADGAMQVIAVKK